jgi:glycosyltransferase involved in cell wall biosynthesis
MMLSVIIATRNRATMVRACLDSIVVALARAAVPLQAEVVIADNGSSDNTVDVI